MSYPKPSNRLSLFPFLPECVGPSNLNLFSLAMILQPPSSLPRFLREKTTGYDKFGSIGSQRKGWETWLIRELRRVYGYEKPGSPSHITLTNPRDNSRAQEHTLGTGKPAREGGAIKGLAFKYRRYFRCSRLLNPVKLESHELLRRRN